MRSALQRLWCGDRRAWLEAWLDETLDAPERRSVERHLGACPACREALSALRGERATLEVHGLRELHEARRELARELHPLRRLLRLLAALLTTACLCAGLTASLPELLAPPPAPLRLSRAAPEEALAFLHAEPWPAPPILAPVTPPPPPAPPSLSEAPTELDRPLPAALATPPARAPAHPPEDAPADTGARASAPEAAPEAAEMRPPAPRGAAPAPPPRTAPPKAPEPVAPPKEVLTQLRRLSVEPGWRYGELVILPIVDRTEPSPAGRAMIPSRYPSVSAEELDEPRPSRILVARLSKRRAFPLRAGLLLRGAWDWRLLAEAADIDELEAEERLSLPVISVSEPDALLLERLTATIRERRLEEEVWTAPSMAPSSVRQLLVTGADSGRLRLALWRAFIGDDDELRAHRGDFAPSSVRLSQAARKALQLRNLGVDQEMGELTRRLHDILSAIPGLRGLALSIGARPVSIDVFPSGGATLAALESLLRGLAIEGFQRSEFLPLARGTRGLLSERRETAPIHQLLLGLIRNLKGLAAERRYRYRHEDAALGCDMQLDLDLEQQLRELVIIKR